MRAELANLNHCAVPFLSRAAVSLSWYDSTVKLKDLFIIDEEHEYQSVQIYTVYKF